MEHMQIPQAKYLARRIAHVRFEKQKLEFVQILTNVA